MADGRNDGKNANRGPRLRRLVFLGEELTTKTFTALGFELRTRLSLARLAFFLNGAVNDVLAKLDTRIVFKQRAGRAFFPMIDFHRFRVETKAELGETNETLLLFARLRLGERGKPIYGRTFGVAHEKR